MTLSRIFGLAGLAGILLCFSMSAVSAEEYDLGEAAAERLVSSGAYGRAPDMPAPGRAGSQAPQTDATDFERFAAKVGVDPSTIGDELGRADAPDPLGEQMLGMIFCPFHQRMERRPTKSFSSGAWQRAPFDPLALPADPQQPAKESRVASETPETQGAGAF